MNIDALERYLKSFGKQVVRQAKNNLTSADKGGALEKSISFFITAQKGLITIKFKMAAYGKFIDKGVSGTEKERSFKDFKGKTLKSPFRYTKQPPSRVLDKWIVKKGIAPRDEKGRFMSRKSISFLIARSIKRKGIQGISFFQKPLMLGLKQFGKEMLGAVKDDIINGLTTVK